MLRRLTGHDVTPYRHWIRSEPNRNLELAFVDLLRQLNSPDHAPRVVETFEAQHRLQTRLHSSMVLLHDVIQVLARTDLYWIGSAKVKFSSHSHTSQRGVAGFMPVQGDAVWMRLVIQCFTKERLSCRNASRSAEIKLNRVSLTIHRPIQIHPSTSNLYKGLVHTPASAHRLPEALPAFFASLCVAHDPTQDRRMGNHHTTFRQHQNKIPIAELEAKVPAEAEKNEFVV